MPTKIIEKKDSQGVTISTKKVRDYKNCKYKEEFLKAGIEANHIRYAYTNRDEFLAVAAEGDTSKYSPEFKEILIKLGMPEFVFDLEVIDPAVKSRSRIMDKVISKNPEVSDFNTLCQLQINEELIEQQETLKILFKILF
jgi:DNA-binding Lrp family transcriptional regulator